MISFIGIINNKGVLLCSDCESACCCCNVVEDGGANALQ